ncbi:facilitated trehalose transporter Tret1-like [Condylostylus longicornis]|uniref:facilitated trehalose transporter Tret1-like n=1 Tax=Condylostylus longicornis TaxID=2530218 RepID=UPI00244E4CD2|nr:facilitated trehalose transporter Tret1-like [Condylostylus longicornis]
MTSNNSTEYTSVTTTSHMDQQRVEPIKTYRQIITGKIANLSSFAVGTCIGWTSPIFPKLEKPDETLLSHVIKSSSEEAAWIGSLLTVGALVAPFVAGPLADRIGRKWTLLSSAIFFIIAYVLLLIAGEVWVMYVARIIQGFGIGFVMTAQPMYIGEISSDEYRGALGSFMQLYLVVGVLYVYAIGPFVSYAALQWCCLVIPIIFAIGFFFMPESPHHFINKGRHTDAKVALKNLRGRTSIGVAPEMNSIRTTLEENNREKKSLADLFKNRGNIKALVICVGLIVFQQLSGINVVLFNAQTIFEDANTGLDPAISTILIGVVQVVACGLTPLIVERLGRKPILAVSCDDISNIAWLPVASLLIYMLLYCLGLGPLPWAITGEMFSSDIKSVASPIVASVCWTLGFLTTRFYPNLNSLGPHVAFFLFGGCTALGFLFTLFVVLETKGLSLQEIQIKLNKNRRMGRSANNHCRNCGNEEEKQYGSSSSVLVNNFDTEKAEVSWFLAILNTTYGPDECKCQGFKAFCNKLG